MFHSQKALCSKNSSWLFDTYLCVECCKTQGNFQHFKAAFVMTRWVHTIASPRMPHLHTDLTLNTLQYKLYYNSSSGKCLYRSWRAKVSPTRSACLRLHKVTALSFRLAWKDQRAFWTVAPCFRAVRTVAWASSKETSFINHSMSTLQESVRNTFKQWRVKRIPQALIMQCSWENM